MKKDILKFLGGTMLGATTMFFGATTDPELTDQQLYILTEIVNDRIPQMNIKYSKLSSFSSDYIKIAKLYKDNFSGAVEVCSINKKDDQCDLYKRIKARIAEIQ